VVLIYFKVPLKYLTGVADERHDNAVAMAIVMVEEILYPIFDARINMKYIHSLCIISRDRFIASSKDYELMFPLSNSCNRSFP